MGDGRFWSPDVHRWAAPHDQRTSESWLAMNDQNRDSGIKRLWHAIDTKVPTNELQRSKQGPVSLPPPSPSRGSIRVHYEYC